MRWDTAWTLPGRCQTKSQRKMIASIALATDDKRLSVGMPLINDGSIAGHVRLRSVRQPNQRVAMERLDAMKNG